MRSFIQSKCCEALKFTYNNKKFLAVSLGITDNQHYILITCKYAAPIQ